MRLGALTTAALASALLLTACTADPPLAAPTAGPTAVATSRPSPAPTIDEPAPEPSPTPTLADVSAEPAPPDALKGPANADNAAAVAEYFLSLFPYLFNTGDTSAWEKLTGPDCGYCADITELAKSDQAKGRHDIGGMIEFIARSATDLDDGTFYATLVYDEHPSTTVDAEGRVVKDYPDKRTSRAQVLLEWSGHRWLVQGVDATEVEDAS